MQEQSATGKFCVSKNMLTKIDPPRTTHQDYMPRRQGPRQAATAKKNGQKWMSWRSTRGFVHDLAAATESGSRHWHRLKPLCCDKCLVQLSNILLVALFRCNKLRPCRRTALIRHGYPAPPLRSWTVRFTVPSAGPCGESWSGPSASRGKMDECTCCSWTLRSVTLCFERAAWSWWRCTRASDGERSAGAANKDREGTVWLSW